MSSKRKSPPNKLEENNGEAGVGDCSESNNSSRRLMMNKGMSASTAEDLSLSEQDYHSHPESESEEESHHHQESPRIQKTSLLNKGSPGGVIKEGIVNNESSSFHEDLREATVRTASASLNNSEGGHMETSGDDEELSEMGSFCSRTNSEDEEMPIVHPIRRSSNNSKSNRSSSNGRCSSDSLSSNNLGTTKRAECRMQIP
jgi:hypothetical protein